MSFLTAYKNEIFNNTFDVWFYIAICYKIWYNKCKNDARRCEMLKTENIKNTKELEFAVFCIENVALSLGVKADKVYHALTEDSDILHSYIVPVYDVLHTQSKEYIVADIIEVMKERGVKV
jgi:hypothetical protein